MSKFQQRLKEYKGIFKPVKIEWSKETAESYFSSYNVQPRRKQWYKRTMTPIKTKNYE